MTIMNIKGKDNNDNKDINLELVMFACLIWYGVFILYKLTKNFGLTLVWCRCVSQVLVAPRISKCRSSGWAMGITFGGKSCRPMSGLRILIPLYFFSGIGIYLWLFTFNCQWVIGQMYYYSPCCIWEELTPWRLFMYHTSLRYEGFC